MAGNPFFRCDRYRRMEVLRDKLYVIRARGERVEEKWKIVRRLSGNTHGDASSVIGKNSKRSICILKVK